MSEIRVTLVDRASMVRQSGVARGYFTWWKKSLYTVTLSVTMTRKSVLDIRVAKFRVGKIKSRLLEEILIC